MTFTDVHLKQLQTEGYCIVERWLDEETLERLRRDLFTVVPTWERYQAGRDRADFRKPSWWLAFPFENDSANDLPFRPDLVDLAERVLGTSDIRLAHTEMLIKYAGAMDFDQHMHMDWNNNTLVVPVEDGFDQLASIVYYSDVTLDLGPTKFVALSDTEGFRHEREWTREQAPELFEREQSVVVPAGSIFLYGMRSLHRGSAMTASEGTRFSQHIAFCRSSEPWHGWFGYARFGQHPRLDALLTRLTPRERELLGFPAPGHPYWTAFTVEGVSRRYPGMDMTPYADAMPAS